MADYDKVIPPGQEGRIGVKLIGYKLHPGRFTKSFSVKTNDPENAKVILKVTGRINQVLELNKGLALSGYRGEELRDEIILTPKVEEPFKITGYHWEPARDGETLRDAVDIDISPIEGGTKYKLEARLNKDMPPKQYMGDLVIETDFDKLPEKKIMFRLRLMDDVEVHPNTVYMRELRLREGTSKSFEKIVSLIAARGDSLEIKDVIPSDESITWNIQEVKPGKAFSVRFQVRPPSVPGKYMASLKFITNYKGYEEIEVPIIGSVRVVNE